MNARNIYWQTLAFGKDLARSLDNAIKPFYCPLQQRNNNGLYAVEINAKVGFFAQLNWCLFIFDYCERHNLKPYLVLSSPFYAVSSGENWLGYYFDSVKLTESDETKAKNGLVRFSRISDFEQLGLPNNTNDQLSLDHANRLIETNLQIKGEIREYVESFIDKHFAGKPVLGVHFRGTDKKSEAKRVTWEFCAKTISNYLDANPHIETLFVSSDEEAFVSWIEEEFRQFNIISHDDKERSKNGNAIHVQPAHGDNYTKGKEALINCLLLSRCNALIRTASFLSGWSSIFNPGLPVVMLNRPYDDTLWFPDALILQKSMNQYLPGGQLDARANPSGHQ